MAQKFSPPDLITITSRTVNHYETSAEDFWEGTRDHDVSQNYAALLDNLPAQKGLRLLDFGCGPGRDLIFFKSLGHEPTGLDGSEAFCKMATKHSGCPAWHQNFLNLSLPPDYFDGIFANASLFHIPAQEFPRVLKELRASLKPKGILFSSNPRGSGEDFSDSRYGAYYEWDKYQKLLTEAGFEPLTHFYRPPGLPRNEQPWLAVVSRRVG